MKHDRRRPKRQGPAMPVATALAGLMAGVTALGLASVAYAQNGTGQAAPAPNTAGSNWVWALYADSNPLVLAQEIPDTPQLKTTLECEPRSGRVRLSLYDATGLGVGPATLSAGQQSVETELQAARSRLTAAVAVDHPVFIAFQSGGELKIAREEQVKTVTVSTQHLPLLRRFAQACAG